MSDPDDPNRILVKGASFAAPPRETRRAFHEHVLRGWQALTHQPFGTRLVLAWKLIRRKRLEGSLAMLRQRTCPITAAFLSDKRVQERERAYRERRKAEGAAAQDSAAVSSEQAAPSSNAQGSAGPKNTSP